MIIYLLTKRVDAFAEPEPIAAFADIEEAKEAEALLAEHGNGTFGIKQFTVRMKESSCVHC